MEPRETVRPTAKPLAIIPSYATRAHDMEIVQTAVTSFRQTVGDAADLIVIDDGSPDRDVAMNVGRVVEEQGGEYVAKQSNDGFSSTVNIGLRRALNEGRDAILINADIEFITDTWLDLMLRQPTSDGSGLASIVGALLIYPHAPMIQHAGVYFSLLYREFSHIYQYGPANLPEAQHARVCPVTGALQFIRHECLAEIGVYDETFRMGWEDVDYCVRAWQSGREAIYQPGVRALHHESFFRSRPNPKVQRWQAHSWSYFAQKHGRTNFAEFVPQVF